MTLITSFIFNNEITPVEEMDIPTACVRYIKKWIPANAQIKCVATNIKGRKDERYYEASDGTAFLFTAIDIFSSPVYEVKKFTYETL